MTTNDEDAYVALSLALMLVTDQGVGHELSDGEQYAVATVDDLTVSYHPNLTPVLLTISAPARVLEMEMDDPEGGGARVVSHVPGPWQQKLWQAAKGRLPWHKRSRLAAPFSRRAGWPFNQAL